MNMHQPTSGDQWNYFEWIFFSYTPYSPDITKKGKKKKSILLFHRHRKQVYKYIQFQLCDFFFSVKNVYISTLIINLSGRYFLITFCENASKLDPLRHHLDSLVTESDTVMAGFFFPPTQARLDASQRLESATMFQLHSFVIDS